MHATAILDLEASIGALRLTQARQLTELVKNKKEQLVSTVLEPWRAGKSVASLSLETAPWAWPYKKAKFFYGFYLATKC